MEGMMGGGMGGMMGGMGGMGGDQPPPIEGVPRAYFVAKQARESLKSRAPTEEELMTKLETICDDTRESGEWLHSYDMIENGRAIELKRQSQAGECWNECKTVGLACAKVMAE